MTDFEIRSVVYLVSCFVCFLEMSLKRIKSPISTKNKVSILI